MNIQTLTTYARQHVFESARFYYGVLLVLTFHMVVRHSLIKFFVGNVDNEWEISRVLIGLLYGLTYASCFFSAYFLKNKTPRLFFVSWAVIVCISMINELTYFLSNSTQYNLIDSLFSGQGFMNIRITFPILFLGVWQAVNKSTSLADLFLKIIKVVVLINAICVGLGLVIDINFFESYPLSDRWGYSGFLIRDHSVVLTSIILIEQLSKPRVSWGGLALLSMPLLFSGTKSGLLSLGLIVFLVLIKSNKIRYGIAGTGLILLVTLPQWMQYLVVLSPFWENIYSVHGAWGVLFSLRNENLVVFYQVLQNEYNLLHWLLGGQIRYENLKIEMLVFDVFSFYGLVGLINFIFFFVRWLPSWKLAIPLLVALGSGSLLSDSFLFVVWGIWIFRETHNQK